MEKLKCKVVMLSATKANQPTFMIHKESGGSLRYVNTTAITSNNQHLYLTSDREIKKGDWCIYPNNIVGKLSHPYDGETLYNSKQIEATTDATLELPLIPQSFIEEYVAKQGKIDEVMIAMDVFDCTANGVQKTIIDTLTKDDCIIIVPIKESWTREEVIELCTKALYDGHRIVVIEEWIKENL